jgi:polysaccharide biosynthesis transport protein
MRSHTPTSHPTSPDDIDLASLGRAARRALPKIAIFSLLAGGGTAVVMSTMAPRYSSQARVEIVSRPVSNPNNPNTQPSAAEISQSADKEAVGTHARKMLSTDIALKMNTTLALAEMPEFNVRLPADDLFTSTLQALGLVKAKPSETDTDRVLAAYYKVMKVAHVRDTREILIDFTTTDAQFSARGANKLAEIYRDRLTVSRQDETTDARNKLKIEVDRLVAEVNDADKRSADFRARTNQFQGGALSTPINTIQLGDLTTELSKISAAKSEADARATAAKQQMAQGTAESNPDVQKSQIIPRLSEQRIRLERQVSELAATLLPGHPRMRQIQGDLSALQRQIKEEVRKVVDALDKDAKIVGDREINMKRRIDDVKGSIKTGAPDDSQLKGLEDTAKAKRAEYERVKKAFEIADTGTRTGDAPVEVKIVQRAFPSNEKVWPKPAFFGPLVALALFLVGLAWAVTRAIVSGPRGSDGSNTSGNDRGRVPMEPTAALAAQPLAAAPRLAQATSQFAGPTVAETAAPTSSGPQLAMAAAPSVTTQDANANTTTINDVADHLIARDGGEASCRTLVAGDRPGVDGAAEALALAKALGMSGKSVVLVDWAHAGSDLAAMTGGVAGPGLAQLIHGDAAFEDVIQKLADTDAHFVPAGDAPADASLVFDADRANLVLDALDEAYEHIIVYGAHETAHDLFEATQGRFDLGVSVSQGAAVANGAGTSFLGFDVADMDVAHIQQRVPSPINATSRRISPARAQRPAEARA